jgi:PAS domain S-box-containing protein
MDRWGPLFFELSPDPSAIVGPQGELVAVNAAWSQRLGWAPGELVSMRHEALVHAEDRAGLRREADPGQADWTYQARYRHRSGQWIALKIHARRETGSGVLCLTAREAEAAIGLPGAASREPELNERVFRQVLDAISDCILVKGPQSRILWANRAFRELYGMSNEQLRNLIDAPFSDPDYTERYLRDDRYVFETGRSLEIPEEPAKRHDGVEVYFNTVKSPITDENGKVVMMVGVLRDITERKRTEALLDEQRGRMLASAKMSALGEMAGGVAHEINNPLAAIHLRAAQLRELANRSELDTETVLRYAEKISVTCERIAKIVQGLRAFVRDVARDPFQRYSSRAILEETLALSCERMRREGVELRIDVPAADAGEMDCRPVELSQVLLNLLNNAADEVADEPLRWVGAALRVGAEEIEFRISDSGPGIRPEVRKRIFDPFFTTKAAGKGTGLGLSVSKGIVEGHRGTVELQSDGGHTCFVVRLPRQQPVAGRADG